MHVAKAVVVIARGAVVAEVGTRLGVTFAIRRMERASGTGSGRSNTEFTTAKVAVFAAIQTAMVRTTVMVNPLSPISERTACRRLRKADPIVTSTPSGPTHVAKFLARPPESGPSALT